MEVQIQSEIADRTMAQPDKILQTIVCIQKMDDLLWQQDIYQKFEFYCIIKNRQK